MSAITERPRLDFDITDKSELERIARENGIDITVLREVSKLGMLTVGYDGTFSLHIKKDDGQEVKITYTTDLISNSLASVY